MSLTRSLLIGLAAAFVSASTTSGDGYFAVLLKRQAPGSPAYNCHDNCGQAIIQVRESVDICNDVAFSLNYENCIQCAGPDNVAIWQYYGDTLSVAGEKCGLGTKPVDGKQDDAGAAIPAETADPSSPAMSVHGSEVPDGSGGQLVTGSGEEAPLESASPSPTDPPGTGVAGGFQLGFSGALVVIARAAGILI